MQHTKWIERTFSYDYPLGLFPNALERVIGTPARVEEFVLSLPKNILNTVIDGWSIQEHVGHLIDLEELHSGRIDDFEAGLKTLRAADMSNKKTNEANHNEKAIQDLLNEFRRERMDFAGKLQKCDEAKLNRTALHPRLKQPMRIVDIAFFVAEHDDHHLASMRDLSRTLLRK